MIAALVNGKFARAMPGEPAVCPECRSNVYARLPAHAVRHWAHKPLPDGEERQCSRDAGEMSEWHRAWQAERTDLECIEVPGEGFRADVVTPAGYVIEFQRSRIAPEDVARREKYWRKGVWVADGTPADDGESRVRLERHPDQAPDDPYFRFRWSPAPQLLYCAQWPVWIDVGDRGLLQMRFADHGRGGGWLTSREWFVTEVVNGTRMVLRSHVINAKKGSSRRTRKAARASAEAEEDLSEIPVHCTRPRPDEPCCGGRPPGVAGAPLVLACQLCPSSPTYWRAT